MLWGQNRILFVSATMAITMICSAIGYYWYQWKRSKAISQFAQTMNQEAEKMREKTLALSRRKAELERLQSLLRERSDVSAAPPSSCQEVESAERNGVKSNEGAQEGLDATDNDLRTAAAIA